VKNLLGIVFILATFIITGCQSESQEVTADGEITETNEGQLIEITFDQFFTKSTTGEGQITEEMLALDGKKVGIKGYMTELTPIDNRFFYLVPEPGAACPFCSADNPKYLEAIAVYTEDGKEMPFTQEGLWAYGTLEVGEEVDEATGLISLFRLKAESVDIYQSR